MKPPVTLNPFGIIFNVVELGVFGDLYIFVSNAFGGKTLITAMLFQ